MYRIKHKKLLKGFFFTYEEARSAVRAILRQKGFTNQYRNPAITGTGYSIVKVA